MFQDVFLFDFNASPYITCYDSIARHYECLQAHENEELLKHYFTVESQDRSFIPGKFGFYKNTSKKLINWNVVCKKSLIFLS